MIWASVVPTAAVSCWSHSSPQLTHELNVPSVHQGPGLWEGGINSAHKPWKRNSRHTHQPHLPSAHRTCMHKALANSQEMLSHYILSSKRLWQAQLQSRGQLHTCYPEMVLACQVLRSHSSSHCQFLAVGIWLQLFLYLKGRERQGSPTSP